MTKPLIDTARYRLRGLSSESFERRELGDTVTLTVKGVIVEDTESAQAHEGTRRVQTLKIEKMVEGVSESVHDEMDGQLSMADVPEDDGIVDAEIAEDDDTPVGGGPQFSSGE